MKSASVAPSDGATTPSGSRNTFSRNSAQILLKVKAKGRKQRLKHRYIINPDMPKKVAFDLMIGVFVMYSVLIVPLRIPFNHQVRRFSGLWVLEAVMDCLFLVDIVLSFF